MSKQIFVNIPVSDLEKSTAFYEALGFTINSNFSGNHASCMVWTEDIFFMLLKRDFYSKFLRNKTIADTKSTSGALFALSLESKEAVQTFADSAKDNGGDYYKIDMGVSEDMMFGYEVEDPDGNHLEPIWMNENFNPDSPGQTL